MRHVTGCAGRSGGVVFFLLALVLMPAPLSCRRAPEGISLRYRFQAGRDFAYSLAISGRGTVHASHPSALGELEETEFPISIEGSLKTVFRTREVSVTGNAVFDVEYKDIHFEVVDEQGGRKLRVVIDGGGIETYDGDQLLNSVPPDDKNFLLKGVAGKTFKLVMTPRGKIEAIETPDSLSGAFPYIRFRELLEAAQPELPADPVHPGESWERKLVLQLPQLADRFASGETFAALQTYTVESEPEENPARISLRGSLFMEEPSAGSGPGTLRAFEQKTDGYFLFDRIRGRLLETGLSLDQEFGVTILIPRLSPDEGIDLDMKLKIELTMKPAGD